MKLWVDDLRPAPQGYVWCHSTAEAISLIRSNDIEILSLDHDAGSYAMLGGDYIAILNWMEESGYGSHVDRIHIHSMNPVGVANMRRIISHNGWTETRYL